MDLGPVDDPRDISRDEILAVPRGVLTYAAHAKLVRPDPSTRESTTDSSSTRHRHNVPRRMTLYAGRPRAVFALTVPSVLRRVTGGAAHACNRP